ncbi:hypothetical protein L1987_24200 [Smallanthus sonchifolius]|uniref:Uncharacterized protein n=1 Tax=Smallanthus sonchifolius TaxID=185202 RepID=A0ACB9IKD3_9ASTR|nr:hypothetical protein L1987_24200 [Smallanthus sonchifolius]
MDRYRGGGDQSWTDTEEEINHGQISTFNLKDTLEAEAVEVHHLLDRQMMFQSIVTVEAFPEIVVLPTAVRLVILLVAAMAVEGEGFTRWMETVVFGLWECAVLETTTILRRSLRCFFQARGQFSNEQSRLIDETIKFIP